MFVCGKHMKQVKLIFAEEENILDNIFGIPYLGKHLSQVRQ
jgi:hypothetical protein